jgi:hypothetical protein
MNLAALAKSGWGKGWLAQRLIERNTSEYPHGLILDFKDEYRGLVKAGHAVHAIAGPDEVKRWGPDAYRALLEANGHVVLARHNRVDAETWREDVAGPAVEGARRTTDPLITIDEAHFVAPQTGSLPSPVKGLATTGRGEGASSIWITQRPAEMDETILAQLMARFIGGFESSADLDKVQKIVEYPVDVHNPGVRNVGGLPGSLAPPGRDTPESLQKHEAEGGGLEGSEWIYSDDSGDRERWDTREMEMQSTHYGAPGNPIHLPE